MTFDDLLARVHAAPKGPRTAACFDYDGTAITGYSASAFYAHRLRHLGIGPGELARTLWAGVKGIQTERDFTELFDISLQAWAGRTEDELTELGERLFNDEIAARLHTEVWELAAAHRQQGHTLVLLSSATRFQVEPMARELGADHVLCTSVEVADGTLTGRAAGPLLWGVNKARGLRALAAETAVDLTSSFGYSNGDEDLPFLETVGVPVAVAPDETLRSEADRRGWPVLDCVPRGGSPKVGDMLRTAGFYATFAAAFGAGLGVGALNGRREQIAEIAGGVGSDLGLALTGVDVQVLAGVEYLWSVRPCVFVFNHQSKIDAIVMMKLLRGGFTGVAKKETKNIPGFGQLFQIAGAAFVDRGNTEQSKQALEPAVAKARDKGISLAMAPEGTRSVTPKLGRFKKGAFHIAMQAGVPMVPIVLRGAGEVMWRGAQVVRPGTVEVVVHPPVDTSDWQASTIDEHVHEVREQFVQTLAAWPGHPNGAAE